jgi:hypothetical protein
MMRVGSRGDLVALIEAERPAVSPTGLSRRTCRQWQLGRRLQDQQVRY